MSQLLSNNIIYGGPITSNEAQNQRSLGHYVVERIKILGDRVVMIDAFTGQKFTARQMYELIVRLAHVMQKNGLQRGDVVGICGENSFEFAVTLFGCFLIGATAAPMNATYSERELDHAINLVKPKMVFASKQTIEKITNVVGKNTLITIMNMDNQTSAGNNHSTADIINISNYVPSAGSKSMDVAIILFSSGTTGFAKGVQVTESNILQTMDTAVFRNLDTTFLVVLPWSHLMGCFSLISSILNGSKLISLPKFELNLFLKTIEKYRVNVSLIVPTLMVLLAKSPEVLKYDLSSLFVLMCGGAQLGSSIIKQIQEKINIRILQGYGLTEMGGVLVQTDKNCKPGSVGVLRRGVYAKVVNPENGCTLGPYQRGELCFKSNTIMKGYVGDTKSTQMIIRDGWLHTGDIGYFDDDFEFFIVDRIKELIKYKSFQVPPAELEALLLTHSKVKDAAVIGKPDEEAGELPLAFIVKQANVQLTENDIDQFVAERVSPAKKLRGGVIFIDEIPKNPSGKILRRVLREMLQQPQSKL